MFLNVAKHRGIEWSLSSEEEMDSISHVLRKAALLGEAWLLLLLLLLLGIFGIYETA